MRTIIALVAGLPIALIVMAVAVVNNQPVTVIFDPFAPQNPSLAVTIPLYALFFITLMAGVFIGGLAAWARQSRFRRASRLNRREATHWRMEAEKSKEEKEPGTALAPSSPLSRGRPVA